MSIGYVDTSVLAAIGFEERGTQALMRELDGFSYLVSSNLLEAELRSAFWRTNRPLKDELIEDIEWIFPTRPLNPEFSMVLNCGYLRGADLLHVSTALYMSRQSSEIAFVGEMSFVTLDRAQREVAAKVGFQTLTL